jgi:phosphoglycerol geranylgeranyltransferase
MNNSIYQNLATAKKRGQKKIALLIDPDKVKVSRLDSILEVAASNHVDYIFLGGSLILNDMMDYCISKIRATLQLPIILFPGDIGQVNPQADALLFLSLISGRNAEFLIGKQVVAAPMLKKTALEIISTGYMLIDGGSMTTAIYMSGSLPIPSNKTDIAICTAMAGEMLGLKAIYMDAGSGAKQPIPSALIRNVSESIDIPLIVGGGIRTAEKALENLKAGADVVVIGNAIEENPHLLSEISAAIRATFPI